MVTLTAWVECWIARRTIRLKPSTLSGYRGNLRRYIAPSPVGALPIGEVTPEDIVVILSPIVAKGYTRQAQLVQILLGAALKDACRQRIIPSNPVDFVDRIQHKSEFTAWLSTEQAAQFLKANQNDPYYPAWLLGICCGLRRGEIIGLRWDDVDFSAGVLHVRRQRLRVDGQLIETKPKSLASIRDVPLAASVADQLRKMRGIGYVIGGTPERLREALQAATDRAEVPRITIHGLRHTMAATAATGGVAIKVLQEMMGHAHYSTTADVYAHVDRCAVSAAAKIMASRLEIA